MCLVHSPHQDVKVSSLIPMCVISGKRREVTEECGSHKPTQQCMKAREREKERSSLQSPKYTHDKVQVSDLADSVASSHHFQSHSHRASKEGSDIPDSNYYYTVECARAFRR